MVHRFSDGGRQHRGHSDLAFHGEWPTCGLAGRQTATFATFSR